jgi:hypothetical protein
MGKIPPTMLRTMLVAASALAAKAVKASIMYICVGNWISLVFCVDGRLGKNGFYSQM